jgi:hypothetical protein
MNLTPEVTGSPVCRVCGEPVPDGPCALDPDPPVGAGQSALHEHCRGKALIELGNKARRSDQRWVRAGPGLLKAADRVLRDLETGGVVAPKTAEALRRAVADAMSW